MNEQKPKVEGIFDRVAPEESEPETRGLDTLQRDVDRIAKLREKVPLSDANAQKLLAMPRLQRQRFIAEYRRRVRKGLL